MNNNKLLLLDDKKSILIDDIDYVNEIIEKTSWRFISKLNLSERVIELLPKDKLHWSQISSRIDDFSNEFLEKFHDEIYFYSYLNTDRITIDFINFMRKFPKSFDRMSGAINDYANLNIIDYILSEIDGYIDWMTISMRDDLTNEFVENHEDDINWHCVRVWNFSSDLFKKHKHELPYDRIFHTSLSEDFFKENWNDINAQDICKFDFTEEFINDYYLTKYSGTIHEVFLYQENLGLNFAEKYWHELKYNEGIFTKDNIFTEEFILKHENDLRNEHWENIFLYQKLSESFIEKYAHKVSIECLEYQELSNEFILKHYKTNKTIFNKNN